MVEDLRYALRQLRKNPGFAAAAILTLGLGIGAAAAMFGLVQSVLLTPPPYAEADRLVLVTPKRIDGQPYPQASSIGQWMSWRTESRTLQSVAMYRWTFNFLVLPDGSEALSGMAVTGNYFKTVGLTPILGREFEPSETSRPKLPPTAIILGYELWQRKFNGDPGIIGRTVRISRYPAPFPVVGVMPPGVRFLPDPANASEPNYDVDAYVDFWFGVTPDESQPRARGWNTVARLANGATLDRVQSELATLARAHGEANPDLREVTATARPLVQELNHEGRTLLMPLFGAVALVFFVACVNVAGLFVARGLQRHREYGMRAALGASRLRLFRQLITESAALSLVSIIVAAGVAIATVALFKTIGGQAIPRADAVRVGWPLFAFSGLAAMAAAVVAGFFPAIRASSSHHAQGLKGSRASVGRGERRLLGAIATVQIVLTVALLAGAALLVRTANNLTRVKPGYETENILAVTVTTVTPNTSRQFHTGVLERVAALPGVRHAAFVWGLPLTGNKWTGTMEVGDARPDGTADRATFPLRAVTPDYFELMGIQVAEGRGFRISDNLEAPAVVIVNQALARRYFPGSSAVGRHVRFAGNAKQAFEIVGVIADTRTDALTDVAEPEVYLSFWQNSAFSKHLVLRAASDPRALVPLVRREVRAVDPTAAVEHFTTMAQIRRESLGPRTFAMRLLVGFGIAATSLSLVGIYGVLALSVGSRVKEIAVRKAVGAQRGDIIRLILGEGARLIVIGVATGVVVAVVFGRALQAQLFDVTPADPISLGAAAAIFGVLSLAIALVPALRAARTDLLIALHQE
jgi:putative ABC transport system permease protein